MSMDRSWNEIDKA